MLGRVAAWIITGPLAFLLAGVLDISLFLLAVAREQLRRRIGRQPTV